MADRPVNFLKINKFIKGKRYIILKQNEGDSSWRDEMKIGDMVKMNGKYVVSDNNRDKVFVVRSRPFDICGTECVLLKGYSGGYAVDGLDIAENVCRARGRKH